jgi:DDE superfamily endonuclease/Winged helix-turn helix
VLQAQQHLGEPRVAPSPGRAAKPSLEEFWRLDSAPQSPAAPSQQEADRTASAPSRRPKRKDLSIPPPMRVLLAWCASACLYASLTQEMRQLLTRCLLPLPARRDSPQRWTLGVLQHWVQEHFGVTYSKETLRRVLHRLGFRWKKARKLLARANTLARLLFLQQLQDLLAQAEQGHLVLAFIDEAHIHCDADLGYGWGSRGVPLWISSTTPGLSYKASFYGIYLVPLRRVHIWHAPWADSEQTQSILCRLRQEYPQGRLVLLWDGAAYHKSAQVRDLAAQLGITLVPLPAYSPDFMPVESLWRWLRQVVTGNFCHVSVAELLERVGCFACHINQDQDALVTRLAIKVALNIAEEELRISNRN